VTEPSTTVDVYWRPGCGFCLLLDRRLKKAGVTVAKHNIWNEPEAAAFVRSVADGSETVPTVVAGDRVMVNPSAKQVLAALSGP
jgi:glutaredoxin-like protein